MLFDESCFQDQRFDFVIGYDELEIGDLADESIGFPVERARAEIGPYAAAKVLGLADVDHLSGGVFVQVDARRGRNFFYFLD